MTQEKAEKLREAVLSSKIPHSKEAVKALVRAICMCEGIAKDERSSCIRNEVASQAWAEARDCEDLYKWLKWNDITDFTSAFASGARHIRAIVCHYIQQDALALLDEAKESLK